MIKKYVLLFLVIFINSTAYADVVWKILDREEGCVPLDLLYHDYPYLIDKRNPHQIFRTIKSKFSDAKLIPMLDLVELERSGSKDFTTKAENKFFKGFTKSNALHIQSEKADIEFNLVTNELCLALRFSKSSKNP